MAKLTPLLLVLSVALAAGCATRMRRIGITPPVTHAPGGPPGTYAQVRQYAVAQNVVWLAADDSWRAGVTIDARNDGPAPLALDLRAAVLQAESPWQPRAQTASAAAAGTGAVPGSVSLDGAGLAPITLAPGQGATFWIVFQPLPHQPIQQRLLVRVPTSAGKPIAVTLQDPARRQPHTLSVSASASTASAGMVNHDFLDSGEQLAARFSLWHIREAWRLGLAAEVGSLYEASDAGFDRASAIAPELSVAWRPVRSVLGVYLAGRLMGLAFDDDRPNRWSPAATAGFEAAWPGWPSSPVQLRLGYTRVLDARARGRNGLSFSMEMHVWTW